MAPEGMVHALRAVHAALKPGGVLIDIRPHPHERPRLEVRAPGARLGVACGAVDESDDGIEYRLAAAASALAVEAGRFDLDERWQIEFRRYTPSLEDLLAYFADTWKDAIIDADAQARIRALLDECPGRRELVVREPVLIERLVARAPSPGRFSPGARVEPARA